MTATSTYRTAQRLTATVLLGSQLAACTSWRPERGSPRDVIVSEPRHAPVRVVLASGRKEVLEGPYLVTDSLVGYVVAPAELESRFVRRAIPVDSVRSVELRKPSLAKSALFVAALGVTAIAIVGAIGGDDEPYRRDPRGASSCPLVYSWDGREWRLDSGTFGGAIMEILARTDTDNLAWAVADRGTLRLMMTNELAETDFVDAISVLAVDHAPDVTVAPSSDGRLHTLGVLTAPRSAVDHDGRDALLRVRADDGWNWESRPSVRDTSRLADVRDGVTLAFDRPRGAAEARLVLDGSNTPWAAHMIQELVGAHGRGTQAWYDSVNANPARARALGAMMAREGFLEVQVRTASGWQHRGFIWEAGPEVSKRQVLVLDLAGVEGDQVEIRLESAAMFWLIDRVALDFSPASGTQAHALSPVRADDRRRGDVRAALRGVDRSYHVLVTGDTTELDFIVPAVPAGMKRSYILRSTGWYRVHGRDDAEPDLAALRTVFGRDHGASRVAVERFNESMRALRETEQ